ncbi:PIN domain-containing protein [Candidatus Peregrinibacteria bacterium]|nr:PIN domain-containing protein [Candidatus Peregrinibacteria bacterium]
MNLVDSSAWLAYLTEEKNAGRFAKVIEDPLHLIVPTVVLYEVSKRMMAFFGKEGEIRHGR